MGELQQVYETILGKPMLRTSFQRKILSMDILKKVAVRMTGGAHKAPFVYKFKPK
jgi:8-oxo-dGTP diphosphatase